MAQSAPIRILYVEDDPGLARLVQRRLQRVGYVVDIAVDGEEGIKKYEADSYKVVFLDQSLPVHDGLEVIRILGSKGPLPPTVMVTGTGDERVAVESMKLGASDYIVKDVAGGYLDLLPSVVEKVLQQQRDVEERQQAQEAYRAVVEHSLQGLHIIQEGREVFVNSAYAEMVGYTKEELLAFTPEQVRHLIHPEDRELVGKHYRERIAGKPAPQRYEFRTIRKDGSVRWVEVFASRIEYNGKPASQLVSIDITERKQAEEALRIKDNAIASSINAIAIGEFGGNLTYVNPAFLKLWGYDNEKDVLGKPAVNFWHKKGKAQEVIEALLKGENVVGELKAKRKDGSLFDAQLSASIVPDGAGKPTWSERCRESSWNFLQYALNCSVVGIIFSSMIAPNLDSVQM